MAQKNDIDTIITKLQAAADAVKQRESEIAAVAIQKIADDAQAEQRLQLAKYRTLRTCERVRSLSMARDWEGVLVKTKPQQLGPDSLRKAFTPATEEQLVHIMTFAMRQWYESSAFNKYQVKYTQMQYRRVDLLGEMSQFRDQAALLCQLAEEGLRGSYNEANARNSSVISTPFSTPFVALAVLAWADLDWLGRTLAGYWHVTKSEAACFVGNLSEGAQDR